MVYQADTIRDQLFSAWSLSNPIARLGQETLGDEPVIHLAHPQVAGQERSKTVEVRKLTPIENVIRHPRFEEVSDTFEITVRYTLPGVGGQLWDDAESNIEDIEEEILRILRQVHNPFDGTGGFFRVVEDWRYIDELEKPSPVLKRRLLFTISKLRSDEEEVFEGFGGILALDTSATTADSKPASDYIYTEAYNVSMSQGYGVVPELTTSATSAVGVPVYFRGEFRGDFSCEMYAKKSDITSSTIEALDNIYRAQANGELAEIVFLHSVDNTEGVPVTFTDSLPLLVTEVSKMTQDEDLVKFSLTAMIRDPTTYTVV